MLAVALPAVVIVPQVRADETAIDEGGAAVVARVGEMPILRAELAAILRRTGGEALPMSGRRQLLEAEAVEQLVNERLLQQAVVAERVEVDPAEVASMLKAMKAQLAEKQIPFEVFLAQSGRDEPSLQRQLELDAAVRKLLLPRITSEALAATFAKHRREIDGTRMRASHIVLRPDPGRGDDAVTEMIRRAEAIRREILKGTVTFTEAARMHSAGPSRSLGGDIGYFPRHGVLHEDFTRAVFSLGKGDVSQPFVTPFGVHLALVTDIQPGSAAADSLRPQLEAILVRQEIRAILDRVRAATPVSFSPGVSHFDGPADESRPRKLVVEPVPGG
jgi:peptidyl-prolyl cis-trans isomerase C